MATSPLLDSQPPPLSKLVREAGPVAKLLVIRWLHTPRGIPAEGEGRPVMVLPGLLASDGSTALLRRTIREAGYRVYGWGMGTNFGARADTLDRIAERLDRIHEETGEAVTLIGWSLGGLYAREAAKRRPQLVKRVITLGSPFSGHPRANNAWRIYELLNDHKVDNPPLDVKLGEKPPVPTIALWSSKDGIVAPASACGCPGEADEQVELDCTHIGFATDPEALKAIVGFLPH